MERQIRQQFVLSCVGRICERDAEELGLVRKSIGTVLKAPGLCWQVLVHAISLMSASLREVDGLRWWKESDMYDIWIACFVLSYKVLEDSPWRTSDWAEAFGVNVEVTESVQLLLLEKLEWKVCLHMEDGYSYWNGLWKEFERKLRDGTSGYCWWSDDGSTGVFPVDNVDKTEARLQALVKRDSRIYDKAIVIQGI